MQHNKIGDSMSPRKLPDSGSITMSQVNTELGRTSTTAISLGESAVRKLANDNDGHIAMSQLHNKAGELHKSLNTTVSNQYVIENLFNSTERTTKHCILTVTGGKIGGGDRSYGSLHSKVSDWYKLTVIINSGAKIIGKGGNGEAGKGGCGGGQTRTDGGHGITFKSGSNAYVEIRSGGQVSGGGAGGNSGWRVNCGYSNSGTGGAGGGGAGYPAGAGGPNGNQGGSCYCSSANRGGNGSETGGGAYGRATGWNAGNGGSTVTSQHGSNGGGLGAKASRTTGAYTIGAHGNGGSAVVGAKSVKAGRSSTIHGDICQWEDIEESKEDPRIMFWEGSNQFNLAENPVYEEQYIPEDGIEECPDCTYEF